MTDSICIVVARTKIDASQDMDTEPYYVTETRVLGTFESLPDAINFIGDAYIWWKANLVRMCIEHREHTDWRKATRKYPERPPLPTAPAFDPEFEIGHCMETPFYEAITCPHNPKVPAE